MVECLFIVQKAPGSIQQTDLRGEALKGVWGEPSGLLGQLRFVIPAFGDWSIGLL